MTAAIGLTCGAGMYMLAAVATLLVLIGLEAMNYVLHRMNHASPKEEGQKEEEEI